MKLTLRQLTAYYKPHVKARRIGLRRRGIHLRAIDDECVAFVYAMSDLARVNRREEIRRALIGRILDAAAWIRWRMRRRMI